METGNTKNSLSNRYRRFFLSQNTALFAALAGVLLMPVIAFFGIRSSGINLAGIYDLMIRCALICTLVYAFKSHKLFLMQAALVGLLFCMLCAQSQYGLGTMETQDSEIYITMGLQGFVFLAGERMILFIQSFICISHFIIHAARRQELVRIYLNEVALLFLLALLIVQLIVAPMLSFEYSFTLYIWLLHLDELFIFIVVACADLILVIDKQEYTGGK